MTTAWGCSEICEEHSGGGKKGNKEKKKPSQNAKKARVKKNTTPKERSKGLLPAKEKGLGLTIEREPPRSRTV